MVDLFLGKGEIFVDRSITRGFFSRTVFYEFTIQRLREDGFGFAVAHFACNGIDCYT